MVRCSSIMRSFICLARRRVQAELRRSPRFRIVIGKQPAQSNDGGVAGMCDFFRVRIVSIPDVRASWDPPCIADGGRGVFPVYDECVAIIGVISQM